MVAVSEAKAPYSSSIGKNQCVDQSSEALYMFQYGVWYFQFKSASSGGAAQPQKCNSPIDSKSMINSPMVQGFAPCVPCFVEVCRPSLGT